MKIALVTGPVSPGRCGVGDYTSCLAEALRSKGLVVSIMAEGPWGLTNVWKHREALSRQSPDVIHLQYPCAGFGHNLGPQLLALGKSCVVTLHEVSHSHVLRKLALYPFTLRSRHLIFTSEYERKFADKRAPWIRNMSSVIPIGSNISAYSKVVARNSKEVLYFGLIMPKKGLEQVLELASLMRGSLPALQMRIVGKVYPGKESYFEMLRSKSAGLPIIWETGLNDEQAAARLASCSVAYLPFPDGASERRASLKAVLANGVSVVTTRSASTPRDLEETVQFSNGPLDALEKIHTLLQNPSMLEEMREKAFRYMEKFTWDRIAELHVKVYEDALKSTVNLGAAVDSKSEIPVSSDGSR